MSDATPRDDAPAKASDRVRRSKTDRLRRSKSERLLSTRSDRFQVRPDTGRFSANKIAGGDVDGGTTLVGQRVAARWDLLRPLRGDRLATVYAARAEDGEEVQLRVVHPQLADREGFRRHFLAWSASLCALEHERVVRVLESTEDDEGHLYQVLEECPGQPLSELLKAEALPFAVDRALSIADQALEALEVAHRAGVLHQQLTPDALLLDMDDRVWLCDFGLTAPADAVGNDEVPLDVIAAKYATPELAEGSTQDERSDVYALGIIVYHLLTGQLPFEGFFAKQLLAARLEGDPAPMLTEKAVLAPALERVVLKSLARDPEARWQSAEAFREALQDPPPEEQLAPEPEPEPASLPEGGGAVAAAPVEAPLDVLETVRLPGLERNIQIAVTRYASGDRLTWQISGPEGKRPSLSSFERGMAAAARVEHPALAPVVRFGPQGGRALLAASEWSGWQTAFARITQGATPERDVIRLAAPLIEALGKAHDWGVAHGAIHPRLIVIEPEGPVLHGLGIVAAVRGTSVSPATDVRDMALVLLQLLAGAHLEEAGVREVRERGLEQATGNFKEILAKASSDDPYATASSLHDVLTEFEPRYRRRSPWAMTLAVFAGLAVVLVGAFMLRGGLGVTPQVAASPSPQSSSEHALPDVSASLTPAPSTVEPGVPEGEVDPQEVLSDEEGEDLLGSEPDTDPGPRESPTRPPSSTLPGWIDQIPAAARPPLPLPRGVGFTAEPGVYLLERDGSELVWIPPGSFTMGSDEHGPSERPSQRIRLEQGLFLGRYEVTWKQYVRFSREREDVQARRPAFEVGGTHPVHYVSWREAEAYCLWAGGRLPYEAEWEYAARGDDQRRFPWGDASPDAALANLNGDEDGFPFTSPVGSFPAGASPFGCLDMAGNVAEWVHDAYRPYGGGVADSRRHSVRGGGWFGVGWDCRTSWRGRADPRRRLDHVGFRIAVSPER